MRKFICVVAIVLSGCVALPSEYYAPVADFGEVRKSMCYEKTGPEDTLKIQFDDVDVRLSVYRTENIGADYVQEFIQRFGEGEDGSALSSYVMYVGLSVPEGSSVVWLQPIVEFQYAGDRVVSGFISDFSNTWFDGVKLHSESSPINSEMNGSSETFKKRTYHKRYIGNVFLGPDGADEIKLKSIKLKVNDEVRFIRNVDFVKQRGWVTYLLNC